MKLAIMQPYFFPYIGYYQLINAVDKFVLYDDVNYINRGWINRNNILVGNKACLFTIPLKNASQNRLIRDIELSDNSWQGKFLKTLEQAYKKAPQFNHVFPLIRKNLESEATHIYQLTSLSLITVAEYLGLSAEFVDSSSIYNNHHLKAQQRILDICIREKTTHYINSIGGMELYSKNSFEQSGIKLNFIKTRDFSYQQFNKEFVPDLSMIDVLMFNAKDEIRKMLDLYELV
jgi:hypothetical protein